jgi:O-antigen/teichoic acid export membrane protein
MSRAFSGSAIRNKLISLSGIDRTVSLGLLNRSWSLISGLATMVLIASFFSEEQQGYYYTFYSLLAMQIFVELGMSGVITTFASHEFAELRWGNHGTIVGDSRALDRFIELVSRTVRLFVIAAVVLLVALVPAGLIFLKRGGIADPDFSWQLPWILAVVSAAVNLVSIPIFSAIMGSGDVDAVNYREFLGGIAGSLLAWLVIILHGGLYAFCAVSCGNIIVTWIYLIKYKSHLLGMVWTRLREPSETRAALSWKEEVWPLQWRIALSWMSGYLIFQLFNPVLFYYHGPIIAGQMGMTLNVSAALLVVAMTWVNVRSPEFGRLIAVRDWTALDRLFARVVKQSMGIVVAGGTILWLSLLFLQQYTKIGARLLPPSVALWLIVTYWILTLVSGLAVYLRAHKKEPFLVLSVAGAIIQGTATWFFGMRYAAEGAAVAFFAVNLVNLPAAYHVWKRCRKEWHEAT